MTVQMGILLFSGGFLGGLFVVVGVLVLISGTKYQKRLRTRYRDDKGC